MKTIAISAISSGNSTFGDNSTYLSYKYNIGFHIWMLSLNDVVKCISLYMSNQYNSLYSAHGTIIWDLCLAVLYIASVLPIGTQIASLFLV